MAAYVSRVEWGARQAKSVSRNITPRSVTAHYGGPSPWRGGFDHNRCASIVRSWQAYHMDGNGWSDIAYTSLVCPHGFRFEGRGPGVRTAANGTNLGNQESYAVCYIAGDGDPLTDDAKRGFLEEAQRLGMPLNRVHSDWFNTSCPGGPLREWVKGGAVAPGVPSGSVDWSALRRFLAGTLRSQLESAPVLSRGATGGYVVALQQALNLVSGNKLAEDGQFGAQTDGAVRAFQRYFGLAVDGVVGPQTKSMLLYILAVIAAGR